MKLKRRSSSENKKRKKDYSAAIGSAAVIGGLAGNTAAAKYVSKGHKYLKDSKVAEKFAQEADKRGIEVINNPGGDASRSFYVNEKLAKKLNKKGIVVPDKEFIVADKDRVDVFAHELGHSKHYKGREGSVLGKLAHKAYKPSKFLTSTPTGWAASFANGFHSGYVSKKKENEGKKESRWNRHKSWALPLAVATPMLGAEFAASRQGIKSLKAAGASKETIRMAKKKLLGAGGTYATMAGLNSGFGELGRAAGRRVVSSSEKKKKKS